MNYFAIFIVSSPIWGAIVCFCFAKYTVRKLQPLNFISGVFISALFGFGLCAIVVIALTLILPNNPQGPLALIVYGPISMFIGELLFTVYWKRKLKKMS